MTGDIYDAFWSEDFWLPSNVTWADLNKPHYPNVRHILYVPILLAIVEIGIRHYLEKWWFPVFASWLGIEPVKRRAPSPNPVLERVYLMKQKIDRDQIQGLAKQVDWTERDVERWLRLRKNQDKPSKYKKFSESAWRCLYNTTIVVFGIAVIWDKPWFWDSKQCWQDYPYHPITDGIWWYCTIVMSYFWTLCFAHFSGVKRKDFWLMLVHHILGITVTSVLWISNFLRIGIWLSVLSDSSILFLEPAKIARYAEFKGLSYILFTLFAFTWFVTRLVMEISWVVHGWFFDFPKYTERFPAADVLTALVAFVMIFNLYWSYLLVKLIYRAFTAATLPGDIRSDQSSDENEG